MSKNIGIELTLTPEWGVMITSPEGHATLRNYGGPWATKEDAQAFIDRACRKQYREYVKRGWTLKPIGRVVSQWGAI